MLGEETETAYAPIGTRRPSREILGGHAVGDAGADGFLERQGTHRNDSRERGARNFRQEGKLRSSTGVAVYGSSCSQNYRQSNRTGCRPGKSRSGGRWISSSGAVAMLVLLLAAWPLPVQLVAFGAKSVQMAANFQTGIPAKHRCWRVAKEPQAWSETASCKWPCRPAPTKQLTKGMYMIESAGFHGRPGLTC